MIAEFYFEAEKWRMIRNWALSFRQRQFSGTESNQYPRFGEVKKAKGEQFSSTMARRKGTSKFSFRRIQLNYQCISWDSPSSMTSVVLMTNNWKKLKQNLRKERIPIETKHRDCCSVGATQARAGGTLCFSELGTCFILISNRNSQFCMEIVREMLSTKAD